MDIAAHERGYVICWRCELALTDAAKEVKNLNIICVDNHARMIYTEGMITKQRPRRDKQ